MTVAPTRTFLDGYDFKPDAYDHAVRMAQVLVRAGLTKRYGVSVHRAAKVGWGVYLTDRTPDQAPPVGVHGLPAAEPAHRLTAA
ncbi:hypothetical protein SLA_2171 [Streptomyces laurentii]|uniref:Uncharacterized protein n=1 Tax=Streptomyces laurentii TaxID=39478 RepID=A0A160NY08_STRLU|nr:hypothetical protein SLA_2171 [Streptomyces laurentii]